MKGLGGYAPSEHAVLILCISSASSRDCAGVAEGGPDSVPSAVPQAVQGAVRVWLDIAIYRVPARLADKI